MRHVLSWLFFAVTFFATLPQTRLLAEDRVIAFLVGDTVSNDISQSVTYGLSMVAASLRVNIPDKQLVIVDSNYGLTKDAILKAIGEQRINPGDAVLWFYCGHGGQDKDDLGPFIIAPTGKDRIDLAEIEKKVSQHKARLSIIIADSCSASTNVKKVFPRYYYGPKPNASSPLSQRLFFDSRGELLIRSSSAGEFALVGTAKAMDDGRTWTDSRPLFTSIFADRLGEKMHRARASEWDDVLRHCRAETQRQFALLCPTRQIVLSPGNVREQESQTPCFKKDGRDWLAE